MLPTGQAYTKQDFTPAYLKLFESGELASREELAYQHLADCDLCARYCHVNRRQTTKGAVCRTGERAVVYSYAPHHGEEEPLRGWNGSGTIRTLAKIFYGMIKSYFCFNFSLLK